MNHREAARILAYVMDRLREERNRQGLTLQRLERISGVTRTMIAKMEKGERSPSLIICLRVADALGVQLGDVLNSVPAKKSDRRK
jgi:XRE family transcriptional regulator, regulator of sulfur utilization